VVKICSVEVGDRAKLLPVDDAEPITSPLHNAAAIERLQYTIDVDGRQPGGIGNQLLSHRQLEVFPAPDFGSFAADDKLTEHVRYSRCRVPTTDVENPLAEDRPINQAIAPEGLTYARPFPRDLQKVGL